MSGQQISKFSWLFMPGSREARARYDQVILESENFVLLPSLGSIVPGWLLLIPKFPIVRLADIEHCYHEEFEHVRLMAWRMVTNQFGAPVAFEHGGHSGSLVSCGIDQAHLHIVPLPFDLAHVAISDMTYQWTELRSDKTSLSLDIPGEYLFVSSNEHAAFAEVKNPTSQWFRKIIAEKTGNAGKWDYRKYQFMSNIDTTLRKLSAYG